jgi:uncharacterized protein with HEPN domain
VSGERDHRDYLQDMLEAAEKVASFISGMTEEQFLADEKTQYAVVRALEVIGEAAKKVAPDVRQEHPQVPWREVVGMRDKLIHDYFGVNVAVVWRTATEDAPTIAVALREILG